LLENSEARTSLRFLTPTKGGCHVSEKDHAIRALFPVGGKGAMNVRYFPGTGHATAEELAAEIARAHAAISGGLVKPLVNPDEGLTTTAE
jgi:hypothetical protein